MLKGLPSRFLPAYRLRLGTNRAWKNCLNHPYSYKRLVQGVKEQLIVEEPDRSVLPRKYPGRMSHRSAGNGRWNFLDLIGIKTMDASNLIHGENQPVAFVAGHEKAGVDIALSLPIDFGRFVQAEGLCKRNANQQLATDINDTKNYTLALMRQGMDGF